MKYWGIETPVLLMDLFGLFLSPIKGTVGDIGLFLNRTWHGRSRNKDKKSHDAILIGLFPAGCSYGFDGYGDWSNKFLEQMNGRRLGVLIDPENGTQRLSNGLYKILESKPRKETPYSLSIEQNLIKKESLPLQVSAMILLLRLVFKVGRPCIRFTKRLFKGRW